MPVIVDRLRRARALVVTAEPGAGKTTRIPPALVADGPIILLQPRRAAARAITHRIADERGWTVGREIGWHIRFDRRFTSESRLVVATEGILTARLQQDPLLSTFRTVVFDEFHERSIHADLSLALAKQAWLAREDLRIVVMSATLDADAVAQYLGDCPVVAVPGRLHRVTVAYAPLQSVADGAAEIAGSTNGHVLCFLPGAREIRQTIDDIASRPAMHGFELIPLHGSLDPAAQDTALRPAVSSARRIVVATNIAETSVTVPGVTAVVDSGLHKVARYDTARAIDSLEVERITQDAADQRAGRAGRESPGFVRRLWDARDRLRPHREPEIHRVDLSAAALDVIALGGDPRRLDWFEPPSPDALEAALALLTRLGAVENGSLTSNGRRINQLPLHPRLAAMLVAANGTRRAARACAILSERHYLPRRTATTSSDLLSALDDWETVPAHVKAAAREIEGFHRDARNRPGDLSDDAFRRAVLAGYPDRVAQRREPRSPRLRLASGTGAIVSDESGVRDGEFIVALDVQATSSEAWIRVASVVDREWLTPNGSEVVHRLDEASGVVKAVVRERYDALVLGERPIEPDPDEAARLLADAWLARGPDAGDGRLLRRLQFAGSTIDVSDLVRRAARDVRSLGQLRLATAIDPRLLRALDRDAPETIAVPSGRQVRLEYGDDGSVSASVKLQEMFGLSDTPRIGPNRVPVLFALLAPNGRPVQITRDLRSFWDRTYADVRKELRARYPKHQWPEDPWSAKPAAKPRR